MSGNFPYNHLPVSEVPSDWNSPFTGGAPWVWKPGIVFMDIGRWQKYH